MCWSCNSVPLYACFHCCYSCLLGRVFPQLRTQRELHSACLVLQSRQFVNARPCSGGRGFKLLSGSLISQSDRGPQVCMLHVAQCSLARHDEAPQRGIRWENVRYWAVQLLCINNFKHSCFCPESWQVITSCRLYGCAEYHRLTVGRVGKVYIYIKVLRLELRQATEFDGQVRVNLAQLHCLWILDSCMHLWCNATPAIFL